MALVQYLGEFFRGSGQEMKNMYELSDVQQTTEEVLVAINDVILIFHVLSPVSNIQKGWES